MNSTATGHSAPCSQPRVGSIELWSEIKSATRVSKFIWASRSARSSTSQLLLCNIPATQTIPKISEAYSSAQCSSQ
eukprot:scaffold58813_cov32-Tisochrysis_lutea.AAC.1